jgi:hypothetical protein
MVQYAICSCGKVVDEFEKQCYWCKSQAPDFKFTEITDPKIIAETIYMADRPRTWYEWFRMVFLR